MKSIWFSRFGSVFLAAYVALQPLLHNNTFLGLLATLVAGFMISMVWRFTSTSETRRTGITQSQRERIALEAFRSGKPVTGYVDNDGTLHIQVMDDGEETLVN